MLSVTFDDSGLDFTFNRSVPAYFNPTDMLKIQAVLLQACTIIASILHSGESIPSVLRLKSATAMRAFPIRRNGFGPNKSERRPAIGASMVRAIKKLPIKRPILVAEKASDSMKKNGAMSRIGPCDK